MALSFEDKNQITFLDLHYNNLNGIDMINFFNVLNKYDTLEHLDISWNQIGKSSESVKTLFSILGDNKNLLRLDISHNQII